MDTREGMEPYAARDDDAESRQMIERIQGGERELVAELYRRHFPQVHGFIRSLLARRADAEDLTHQVFESMVKGLSTDELTGLTSLRGWLYAVARNRVIDYRRKHGRVELAAPADMWERATMMLYPEALGDEDDAGSIFQAAGLAAALRRLPPRQREVVLLRYVGDF